MPSFFELLDEPAEHVTDYIEKIDSPFRRAATHELFELAQSVLRYAQNRWSIKDDLPIIKVKRAKEINAEGIDGLIVVSSGLIDYCLGIDFPQCPDFDGISLPLNSTPPLSLTHSLFIWAVLHEFFHAKRNTTRYLKTLKTTICPDKRSSMTQTCVQLQCFFGGLKCI